jgi:hypothetical protein
MSSCSTNLGPREQRKRWMAAVAALAGAVMCALALHTGGLWPRIGIVLSFAVAAFCVMQARSQTCILLAYTGQRNLDHGNERVGDLDERRAMIRRANMVVVKALAIAALATIAFSFV